MKNAVKYYILPAIACSLLIILDQAVKGWARTVLKPEIDIPIIDGFIRFAYVENEGAAFGILQGAKWFFIPITIIMLLAIGIYYARLPRENKYWFARVPMVLIFAGAIGNFIDRTFNGYVVDMFEFEFIRFPVFNVADICIVSGAVLMAVAVLFIIKEQPDAKA